jgi:hypothetical protein
MIRFTRPLLAAAVLGMSLAACSDSTGPDNTAEAAGVYLLQTIDGQNLPVIVDQQGQDMAEVTAGTVTLDTDLSFDDVTELRITEGGVVTTESDVVAGTWTMTGNTVRLNPGNASADYTMSWDGADQLTQLFNGFTLVYRR